jgi:four helix bundle protein
MGAQADALRRRIADFALAVLRFVRSLPRDVASDSIIRQVARSASGIAGNYRAACSARSTADFIAKLALALEEADETDQWLWMAQQLQLGRPRDLARLAAEGKELQAILSASLSTARRNLRREIDAQHGSKTPHR